MTLTILLIVPVGGGLVCQFSSDSCLKLLSVSSFPNNKYYSLNYVNVLFLIVPPVHNVIGHKCFPSNKAMFFLANIQEIVLERN